MKYNRENLKKAFNATLEGMSVYKAAKVCSVPESTLRDRTLGIVPIDVSIGFTPIFNREEEEKLVAHIKYMADVGYGYNKRGAREYAASLGKDLTQQKSNSSTLSNCWFYGFLHRWPDLKVASPQKLTTCRAEAASRHKLNSYYKELSSIMTRHNIRQSPEQIYNIDETGISTEHNQPKIICSKSTKPQAITSARSSLTTTIAAGNAIGNHLPPFYVFKGKRWSDDLLKGSVPGAEGIMTETGWSNTQVFEKYLTEFFAKHTGISDSRNQRSVLVLYDWHKSHVSLTLTDWAKRHNVILFVLPPHTSHLTQHLDVAIFGLLKSMYNKECQMFLQRNPGTSITKHLVAELTAKPYLRALSPENLTSAFKKTGIYPFNNKVISNSEVAPSIIYEHNQDKDDTDNNKDQTSTKSKKSGKENIEID
ncbi:uncharacterized protein LOC134229990 [Saccostrea cucullata]|uniref:uncharacterized protein LOC134229990 n=1 Tax=Saccostrea cuccullata TaxID=36930 RepID=UPI002ED4A5F0